MDSIRKRRPSGRAPVPAEPDIIRIAVFDDWSLFREAVVHVLDTEPDMEVVLESGSGSPVRPLMAGLSFDIAVVDANLMAVGKILWQIIIGVCPAAKILVMAHSLDRDQLLAIFAAGVRGYILKGASKYEFVDAVRALHRNEGYMSPTVGASMLANACPVIRQRAANSDPLAQLSFRESEILNLLAAGLKNSEIGRRLGVTEKTIKRYVTRIFEKLHVRNRVEAAMLLRPGTKTENVPRSLRVNTAPPAGDVDRKGGSPDGARTTAAIVAKPNGRFLGVRG